MTSIHELTGSNYLKASDIGDREIPVTVASFAIETVGRDEDAGPAAVARFNEHPKGMVIKAGDVVVFFLEVFQTDNIEVWDAAVRQDPLPIVLYTVPTNLGPGIRVKRGTVQQPQQPQQPMQQPQQPMQPGGYQQQMPQQTGGYQQPPQPGGYQQTMPRGHWWPPSEQQAPEPPPAPPHPPTF